MFGKVDGGKTGKREAEEVNDQVNGEQDTGKRRKVG